MCLSLTPTSAWKAVEVIDFREFHVWSLSWQMDERCIPVLERCVHARKVTFNQYDFPAIQRSVCCEWLIGKLVLSF